MEFADKRKGDQEVGCILQDGLFGLSDCSLMFHIYYYCNSKAIGVMLYLVKI